MKKILILTLTFLLSLSVFGRPRENPAIVDKRVTDWVLNQLEDMGYTILPEVIVQDTLNRHKQKFSSRYETKGGRGMMMPDWANDSTWSPGQKKEWDDLYYNPKTDGKKVKHIRRDYVKEVVDTLVKENPNIQVTYINNYYDPFYYSNMIGRFYHGGFNYWMYSNPWYYSNWMYDPYDFYWDMRFSGYPYWSYPYYNNFYFGYNSWNPWRFNYGWGHNWYGNNHNWYGQHNNYYSNNNFGNRQQPQYDRRERPSNLSSTYNNSVNRRVAPQANRNVAPQNRATYSESRRSYSPSYNTPRMSTRPAFNNSRTNTFERRDNMNGMRQGNMNTQRSTQSRTQVSTDRRTYQPNQNYTTPSRSYSPPANRSSEPQGFGRTFNFNSGNDRRSSGTSNFSSGSNNSNNSSSSGSSGGRSSGGGSSSGRR